MKPDYKKHFVKMAVIWAGCLVLFVLAYMLIISPQKKAKEQVLKQLVAVKQEYETAVEAARDETRTRLKEQLEELKNKMNDFVVDFDDRANVNFDIMLVSNEKELDSFVLVGKKRRPGQTESEYQNVDKDYINVKFNGSFNQFASFLNELERHQPVLFVDKFVITRSRKAQDGNPIHPVSMDLMVFVSKRKET